tara:strand:- start:197 stop:325 length:129 start_codon:yes stop_codon:yes gene_type:complete
MILSIEILVYLFIHNDMLESLSLVGKKGLKEYTGWLHVFKAR